MRLDYPEPTGMESLDTWLEDLVGMLRYPDRIEAETLRIFGPVNLENFSSGYMGGWAVSEDALSSSTSSGRFGNLNGFLDYSADTFGIGIGNTGANMANLSYDSTNGLRMRTDTTEIIVLDNAGNAYISGTLTIGSGGIPASTLDGWAHASDLTKIDGGDIYTNTVTATQIAANTITADEILGNTITASEIAANTITASEIAGNTITASEIAATTITASEIAANTITADQIAGNTITATEIAALTITGAQITGAALSAIYADLGTITAGNITLNTSGFIRTDGKDNYADTTAGIFFGYDTDAYKLNLGNATDYLKWSGSGVLISSAQANAITIKSGGNIKIEDGGDLSFSGSTYSTTLDYSEVGTALSFDPSASGVVNVQWGAAAAFKSFHVRTIEKVNFQADEDVNNAVWLTLDTTHAYADAQFTLIDEGTTKYLKLYYENGGDYYLGPGDDGNMDLGTTTNHLATVHCNEVLRADAGNLILRAYEDASNEARVEINRTTQAVFRVALEDEGTTKSVYCTYENGGNQVLYPLEDMEWDLGISTTNRWDEAYADNWNNEADFYLMDNRKDELGNVVPIDDVGVIKGIEGSSHYNELTGLQIINDDTLPDWLLVKHKRDGFHRDVESDKIIKEWKKGDIVYSLAGKPYLSLKTMVSLLMGAVRQGDNKVEELVNRIEALETA